MKLEQRWWLLGRAIELHDMGGEIEKVVAALREAREKRTQRWRNSRNGEADADQISNLESAMTKLESAREDIREAIRSKR